MYGIGEEPMVDMVFDGEVFRVHQDTLPCMFRHDMSELERREFEKWGRDHASEAISPAYHPITQNAMWLSRQRVQELQREKHTDTP